MANDSPHRLKARYKIGGVVVTLLAMVLVLHVGSKGSTESSPGYKGSGTTKVKAKLSLAQPMGSNVMHTVEPNFW